MSAGLILALVVIAQHGYDMFQKQYYIQMSGSIVAFASVVFYVVKAWS